MVLLQFSRPPQAGQRVDSRRRAFQPVFAPQFTGGTSNGRRGFFLTCCGLSRQRESSKHSLTTSGYRTVLQKLTTVERADISRWWRGRIGPRILLVEEEIAQLTKTGRQESNIELMMKADVADVGIKYLSM